MSVRRTAISPDQRGATAVIVAASLVLLFGMAAIAIDIGSGFTERRQAQSAADFSALAAAQFSNLDSIPSECDAHPLNDALERAACRGAVEAMAVATANLPGKTLDWAACTDPEPARAALYPLIAEVELSPGVLTAIDCIRFTGTTQAARVAVPILDVPTTFGRVLGADTLNVRATAEAGGSLPEQFKVIPFGIPANADSTYECLKAGPNPDWGVCQGNNTNGNFGYMSIPTYGNPDLNTTSDNCNPSTPSLISNIVRGVDHGLGSHPNGTVSVGNPALRDDTGNDDPDRFFVCPIFGSNANEIGSQTGNVQGAFDTGMTFGYGASERGRLWANDLQVRNAGGSDPATTIDNTPLWEYFTTYSGGASSECPTDSTLTVNNTQTTIDCLSDWNSGDGVIFDKSILGAPRYAFAPKLHDNFSTESWYLIEQLQPLYLHTTYWGCSSGGGAGICDIIHVTGESNSGGCSSVTASSPPGNEPLDTTCGVPGQKNDGLNGVTSFILDRGMLPPEALIPLSSDGPLINISLTR